MIGARMAAMLRRPVGHDAAMGSSNRDKAVISVNKPLDINLWT